MKSYQNTHQIHQAYVDWLEQQDYGLKVTLNFKPNTKPHQAIIQASRLWNMVDRAVFGANAVKRYNQRLNRICVLEGIKPIARPYAKDPASSHVSNTPISGAKITMLPARSASFASANPHYHCAVKTAGDVTYPELAKLIDETWHSLRGAGRFSEVQLIDVDRRASWLAYITKQVSWDSICLRTSTITDIHRP